MSTAAAAAPLYPSAALNTISILVRNKPGVASQFADDEYVIYNTQQQRLEYLVEFTL